jgi:hypothetical protein
MSNKPIFVATHPRACSTAFERVSVILLMPLLSGALFLTPAIQVFMTRRDTLACVHEPFGDAFYYGQERLSERFKNDEKTREESGYANSTFKTIFECFEREGSEVRPSLYAIIRLS